MKPKRRRRCECGNLRQPEDPGCSRCLYLDGHNPSEGRVIEYLRDVGRFVSSDELREDMAISKEHTLRVLRRLIDKKRVVRIQFDNDPALFCLVDGVRRPSMESGTCFKRKQETARA